MKKLVFDVFGNTSNNGERTTVSSVSSCRGWSKIRLFKVTKLMSCRGWSKISLYIAR